MPEIDSSIKVFKFGGASVKSADGVRNLARIVGECSGNILIVVSAMGKTTNAFERILAGYMKNDKSFWNELDTLKEYHFEIANSLFEVDNSIITSRLNEIFVQIEKFIREVTSTDYNYCYDQLVSFGEILSSVIVSEYLNKTGIRNSWVDIRESLRSDANYREGNIDFEVSEMLCRKAFTFDDVKIYTTQGFIAGTSLGTTTTLGREGSDYSAALLANLLDASDVTIWKDVDGVLNADPRIFENTIRLDTVTFKEAIELAYCGAQIIHPKTIKPLQNKKIPLFVKSFVNPKGEGTRVIETDAKISFPPILILKTNQVLISLSPRDFSFVIEDCLSKIFAALYKHRVKANLVQSSAIDFSICVDDEEHFLPGAVRELRKEFKVRYNKNLNLLTVRHFNKEVVENLIRNKTIFLEQKTRSTARFVINS